jgi:L-threonylcarbamoyladenylate synthase
MMPTETSYALAGDATSAKAVRRIFKTKGRKETKSLPLIVDSLAMAKRYANFQAVECALAKRYWPGPLTLVLKKRRGTRLASGVVAKDGTVALRVSSHPTARAISRSLRHPLISTSANRAGEPPLFSAMNIPFAVDAVMDVGRLPMRKPSTIVRVKDREVEVLREGAVRL